MKLSDVIALLETLLKNFVNPPLSRFDITLSIHDELTFTFGFKTGDKDELY